MTSVDVHTVIVGAGFAGIGMGIRLKREGRESFVILERAGDVGGTWRDNVYPGVACDIPSHLYSFSFRRKSDWSRFFAGGAEIQQYLRESAHDEGLLEHLRFGSDVREMRWDVAAERWHVRTATAAYTCRVLVIAAGRLSEPKLPDVPGLDGFTGEVFHSSRWPEGLDLAGRRVGVVGTGASAVQLAPSIAGEAASVTVFQRTASWVVPRDDREYAEAETTAFAADPDTLERLRADLFWKAEAGFAERIGTPGFIDRLRDRALGQLESQISRAAQRTALTPSYEIGCKRVLLSDDYYPAIESGAVALEASALARVDGAVATAASGASYELDVLVLATGFESTRPPFAEHVVGADGRALAEHWSDGMAAFASTTVHGFPNLFVIDGPNASLGHNSAVFMIETQIDYVLGALEHLDVASVAALDVTLEAQQAYVRDLDERAAATVWLGGGCDSWYVDERSRRLTLLWPDFAYAFRDEVGTFDPAPYARPPGARISRGSSPSRPAAR